MRVRSSLVAAIVAALLCGVPAVAGAERLLSGEINLNTASVEQLRLLPGVGVSRAKAIMAERMRRPFRRPWEITRVRGLGRAFFKKLEKHLRVDGETTLVVLAGATSPRAPPARARGEPRREGAPAP
jgi:competence protein ComEA